MKIRKRRNIKVWKFFYLIYLNPKYESGYSGYTNNTFIYE